VVKFYPVKFCPAPIELYHKYLYLVKIIAGLKKKLHKLAKEKDCNDLNDWIPSIINHLYWSVMSSESGSEEIIAKWTSLINHIINVHEHDNPLFPQCAHAPLTGREAQKKWIDKGWIPTNSS
jgi:hypothetical protein